ncbi:MAG: PAS domain S-box protein [Spirochaetia bacterium]|nr:PAS domain S-box protein [Spirochaetia bacterium]
MILPSENLFAQSPVIIDDHLNGIPPGFTIEYLEDKDGVWTIQDIISDSPDLQFIKSNKSILNKGFTDSTYWVRLKVINPHNTAVSWHLEMNYPLMDTIDLFKPEINSDYEKTTLGDHRPFNERKIKHRNVIFPITESPNSKNTYFLRIKTTSPMIISPYFWSTGSFLQKTTREYLALGLFYGIISVMILYNLFLFFSVKDKSYFFYIAFISTNMFFNLVLDGFIFQVMPFQTGNWINKNITSIIYFNFFWVFLFSRSFLNVTKNDSFLYFILLFFTALSITGIFTSFLIEGYEKIQIVSLFSILSVLIAIFSGIFRLLKGYVPARYFLFAWIVLFLGTIILSMKSLGILPDNLITHHSIKVGSALEVVLLSLALADRINSMRKEKENAQDEAIAAIKENYRLKEVFTSTLEEKIEMRTDALKKSEERYRLLVDLSPDGIFVYTEKEILFLNFFGAVLLGEKNSKAILNKSLFEFIHPDSFEKFKKHTEQVLHGENNIQVAEIKFQVPDRYVMEMDIHSTQLEYNGKPAILSICRDITQKNRTEKLRKDTENIIRHDLKNPLSGIIGFSKFIMKETSDQEIYKYASIIFESSNQMIHMLNNSLDLFKMEEGSYIPDLKKFNLIEIFTDLNEEFALITELKSINLKFFINNKIMEKDENCPFTGVKYHLKSMFANLIQNAVDASPENGEVTVNIKSGYIITIHNEGCIPGAIQKNFFDKYITYGKSKGTGIGTYSALLIAKSHHGNIAFETSEKTGTDLIVNLPEI